MRRYLFNPASRLAQIESQAGIVSAGDLAYLTDAEAARARNQHGDSCLCICVDDSDLTPEFVESVPPEARDFIVLLSEDGGAVEAD